MPLSGLRTRLGPGRRESDLRRRVWRDSRHVYKLQAPWSAEVEAAKTLAASRIAADMDLFRVPRLVHHDRQLGLLVFEIEPGLVTLPDACGEAGRAQRLGTAAGQALRAIHSNLKLGDALREPLPGEVRDDRVPSAFLHGDFNGRNVLWQARTQRLVVLDWMTSDVWGGRGTEGPVCFDALWFMHTVSFAATSRRAAGGAAILVETFAEEFFDRSNLGRGDAVQAYMKRGMAAIIENHRRRRRQLRFALHSAFHAYPRRLRRVAQRLDQLFPAGPDSVSQPASYHPSRPRAGFEE